MTRGRPKKLRTPAVCESMAKMRWTNYIIRVWRAEKSALDAMTAKNEDLRVIVRKFRGDSTTALGLALCAVSRVNAVEILNLEGDGMVLYSVWP